MPTRAISINDVSLVFVSLLTGLAMLGCPGARNADVNRDGSVNILDVSLVASCLGTDPVAIARCAAADTDHDQDVDESDLEFVTRRFHVPSFPALVSSVPAGGASNVPRTAWLRLEFADPVSARALATIELACGSAPIDIDAYRIAPATILVNPVDDLPSSIDCEITWPGPSGPEVSSFQTATTGAPAEVLYDRSDRSMMPPFPDDYWLVPDPSKPTGVRVALEAPDREPDVVQIFQALITDTAVLDGFSPLAMIAVELSDAPAPDSLPMSVEASLDPMATIGLFDLTPGSAKYGQRIPFALHVRNDDVDGQSMAHTLVAFPSIPLTPGGRYGFVVTRRAFATPSRPFDPSGFFRAALGGATPDEDASVAAVRDVAEDVVDALSGVFPPIPREDIALALRISVRSTSDIPRDVLAMRQQADAEPPPSVTVNQVDSGFGPAAAVVHGTWQAPSWSQSVFLSRDNLGAPRIVRHAPVPFVLSLPEAALHGPVPITIYQHGSPGSAEEVASVWQDDLVQAGFAVVGFTDALNRYFPLGSNQYLRGLFGILQLTQHFPDFYVETYGEQLAFLRALQSLAQLDILPIGAPDGKPELDLQRPLTYRGISQGSVHGQAFLAYAPEVKAAALVTGAMRYAEALFRQDSTDPLHLGSLLDFIRSQIPNARPPDVWVAFSVLQMVFDRQDGHNHAQFLYHNRIEVAGTTKKASVLIVEGINDGFVPSNATRSLAWSLGPIPQLAPVLEPALYLDATNGPVVANIDADTTAAFVQYAPNGLPNLPPSPGCESWSEGHYCGQIASSPQQIAFFRSALEDGAPTIIGTEFDSDEDGLSDFREATFGADPLDPDTDDDGLLDGAEVAANLDPTDPADAQADYDSDGLSNAEELAHGTQVFGFDTDSDGLGDGDEVRLGTNPRLADTDGGGRRDGAEVQADGTDPLDPADDLPIATLPVVLLDRDGFRWDVSIYGSIYYGTNNAFSGGLSLDVDSQGGPFAFEAPTEESGREIVIGPELRGSLRISRKVFVPSDDAFARFLEIVENTGVSPAQVSVGVSSYFGFSPQLHVTATSSGDTGFTDADDFVVTDDVDGTGAPAVAHVFSDPLAGVQPQSVFASEPFLDNLGFRYALTIPPGGKAIVMHFAAQAASEAAAESRAAALVDLQGSARIGLSEDEQRAIVNFQVVPDADHDGLSDADEAALGTDPGQPDSDLDGLLDGFEVHNGFDPLTPGDAALDPDADGLDNLGEQAAHTNPQLSDSDADGLGDGAEVALGTNPLRADSDADGLSDGQEAALGTDPLDATADADGDGLSDVAEVNSWGTLPLVPDTDGDGLLDGAEVTAGLNPIDALDAQADYDGDGLSNADEIARGTGVFQADTDFDGLLDGDELVRGTNPLLPDTDGGGRVDGQEVNVDHTNPLDATDDLPFVSLPVVLVDGTNFMWDVSNDGSIGDGTNDAFDGGLLVVVNGAQSPYHFEATTEEGGREIVIGPDAVAGVLLSRKVFVPADDAFARYLEVLENPGSSPTTIRVEVTTNLGSDGGTQLVATSDGDARFSTADNFIVTDDIDAAGDPTIAHIFSDATAALQPSSVFTNAPPDDTIQFDFDVLLPPGGTAIVLHFAVQSANQTIAVARAQALVALDGSALAGLSEAERAAIVNFTVAP